jgi:hypothetical protein
MGLGWTAARVRGRSKWPTAQAVDMFAKTTPDTAGGRRASGTLVRPRRRAGRRRASAESPHERVRLITFVWSGRTGDQPVIFADRSWLQ